MNKFNFCLQIMLHGHFSQCTCPLINDVYVLDYLTVFIIAINPNGNALSLALFSKNVRQKLKHFLNYLFASRIVSVSRIKPHIYSPSASKSSKTSSVTTLAFLLSARQQAILLLSGFYARNSDVICWG